MERQDILKANTDLMLRKNNSFAIKVMKAAKLSYKVNLATIVIKLSHTSLSS
jgi:hypothetical protein